MTHHIRLRARAARAKPGRSDRRRGVVWAGAYVLLIAALAAAGIVAQGEPLGAFAEPCGLEPAVRGPHVGHLAASLVALSDESRRHATRLVRSGCAPDHLSTEFESPGAAVAPAATLEYQVKAAFLLSFVTFTEWPATAFESPTSPVRVCVMGRDPFEGSLGRTVDGETVAGHPLVTSHVDSGEDVARCHVLFVPRTTDSRGFDLNRGTTATPVLIVGESDALWHNGALISFAIDEGRVRFDVNRTAAERIGLRFSSKLLRIARLVR